MSYQISVTYNFKREVFPIHIGQRDSQKMDKIRCESHIVNIYVKQYSKVLCKKICDTDVVVSVVCVQGKNGVETSQEL